jgi:hypothetical protein
MKLLSIRPLLALSVAALLTACGGNVEQMAQIQTAAMVQTSLNATEAIAAAQGAAPAGASNAGTSAAAMAAANPTANAAIAAQGPQPDCAPEGCRGLRIIDANAEEYRLKAQRLAAAEMGGDTTL